MEPFYEVTEIILINIYHKVFLQSQVNQPTQQSHYIHYLCLLRTDHWKQNQPLRTLNLESLWTWYISTIRFKHCQLSWTLHTPCWHNTSFFSGTTNVCQVNNDKHISCFILHLTELFLVTIAELLLKHILS